MSFAHSSFAHSSFDNSSLDHSSLDHSSFDHSSLDHSSLGCASFSFGAEPATPPGVSLEAALLGDSLPAGHRRSSSLASASSSQGSSPESVSTQLTTPARSPIRQHGPLLLPKIRPQDQEIHSPPKRLKKMPVPVPAPAPSPSPGWRPAAGFRPSHARSYTNPESVSFGFTSPDSVDPNDSFAAPNSFSPPGSFTSPDIFPPPDSFPSHTRSMSTLCAPLTLPSAHERRASSADLLDTQTTLGRYGFPTYRQLPTYTPSATHSQTETLTFHHAPSPPPNAICPDATTLAPPACPRPLPGGPSSSLMAYLTSPNPAPALVRQLNIRLRDASSKHCWWDIRQIRPWTAFNPATIARIPGLQGLLSIPLPASTFPTPPRTSLQPETEAELLSICDAFYTTKLNAALSLSLGPRHLAMRAASAPSRRPRPGAAGDAVPSFTSHYTDDASPLFSGRGLGRVVGLVKSFDRWNSGMRVEGNHRKVEYLRGLAHLHRCMRDHGCRYGFLLTEIELVVVRNGSDAVPHFGYLEIQAVQLAAAADPFAQAEHSFALAGEVDGEPAAPRMTALLALWYLHMLARDDALPGQVGWRSEVGAPAEGTRRKCLPKDAWIPEPQLAEKREAKRGRGWVWPEESVGRKELGRRGVKYGC
ncbi:hypothetical protein PZA11_005314 [Diplocarpon coronariae]